MAEEALLSLEGVAKRYHDGTREREVFSALDARFERGGIVALLGRSGSGKSTLLNLLGGIDVPDAGVIRYDGRDIGTWTDRERTLHRRRNVGFVFQFFNLLPTLTVRENLLLPLELLARPRAAAEARVVELLSVLGIADRGDDFPDQLSGGEQQRVAVARALVHEPELVLADEPTGNLDTQTGREVIALLVDGARARGRTLILATHSEEVAAAADRRMRVADGRLRPVDGTGGAR